jgi:hypothetical protein
LHKSFDEDRPAKVILIADSEHHAVWRIQTAKKTIPHDQGLDTKRASFIVISISHESSRKSVLLWLCRKLRCTCRLAVSVFRQNLENERRERPAS